jgi:2-iminobutanoate/2-iminopropanoate deaminase
MSKKMNWDVLHYPTYWIGDTTGEIKRTELAYPHVPKEHPKFAQSMAVGNLLFVSGCTGQDTVTGGPTPTTIEGQMKNALDNAKIAMETAGSSLENVVKTFILARSLDDYKRILEIEAAYYAEHAPYLVDNPPATTLMLVASLARPKFLFEYEMIGVIDRNASGWGVTGYPEYCGGKKLAYPHVPMEHAKFARTEVVGNLAILSGCQALDNDSVRVETNDFKEQTRIVMDKIKNGMEETGGSLNNLVKTNIFLKDLKDLPRYRDVERAYFEEYAPELAKNPPASTAMVIRELTRAESFVEVEAFGVIDKTAPDWTIKYYPGSRDASAGVAAGNLLFLSGCDGSDPNTGDVETDIVEQQIIAALDKVKAALEDAGSSMDKVVRTLMMLRRLEDYPKMRKTEVEYYQKHAPHLVPNPPVSTFMQLPVISSPGTLFQIDVIAVL